MMTKRVGLIRIGLTMVLVLLLAGMLPAHPHFRKTISVELGGAQLSLTYQTTPANPTHAQNAQVGAFTTPRRPVLKLSADLQAGSVKLAAGEYTVGVIKNSPQDWTMALYPGQVARGETPDASKLIKLDSSFKGSAAPSDHLMMDISPGHGKFQGKAVLVIHFGDLMLEGALS